MRAVVKRFDLWLEYRIAQKENFFEPPEGAESTFRKWFSGMRANGTRSRAYSGVYMLPGVHRTTKRAPPNSKQLSDMHQTLQNDAGRD